RNCGTSARISIRRAKRAIEATGTRVKAPSSTATFDADWSNSASSRPAAPPPRSRRNSEGPHMTLGSKQVIAAWAAVVLATAIGVGRALAQGGQAAPAARPAMVDDVFKNVQALKGIGVDDFLLTMGIMSAAVGS